MFRRHLALGGRPARSGSFTLRLEGAIGRVSTSAQAWGLSPRRPSWVLRYSPLHPLAAEDDQAFIVEDAEIDALIVELGTDPERGRPI